MDVFGSSGTRGVANEEITPAFVLQVVAAAGTVLEAPCMAVARDTRSTGRMLENAAVSGLQSVGCDVHRLGVIPTPGAQAYAAREGMPTVMITASHNPPEYNGIKLIGASGTELSVSELEVVEEAFLSEIDGARSWSRTGDEFAVEDATRQYVEGVREAADREKIADADLTVAIDPGHGAASLTSPRLFRELGCRVLTVNAQPDGRFPGRDPEPVETNLEDLGRLVATTDADVGIAHDGDGDRAIFFDETGRYIEGDAALAALADAELGPRDATVAAVNVSQRLVDVCERTGADLELTPIGSTYITSRIQQLQAEGVSVPVAGEGNGGIYFPEYSLVRDGAYIAARFLELLADRPASELVAPFGDYCNVRLKLTYETREQREAMLEAVDRVAESEAADRNTTDGVRLDYGDGWVLARPSGTEPVIRIYAEARGRERAEELAARLYDAAEAARDDAK
ncbi:phosphoglucosamine mutase [Halalkalicoccus jeotgali]|uniref:Phosphoglucosamine mutase n=1 Tax=Halalkalicoccus jeotgali (strain DSM 18796 / CECT 7217 / JCM 14584 / KCTC 4019 / B3) TaxID=795797 RepID=D8J3V3_HALJB|nr:phosphoglucosamine mutase [Halalkalicoccus jeotgali]ADJ13444.1 Phosphoglucosamine mutase [Halalkalicoccus jeotgali B3]ELY33081.1 phosphoglucosamine mutase [Halalkalicoccus jeotgali B3]